MIVFILYIYNKTMTYPVRSIDNLLQDTTLLHNNFVYTCMQLADNVDDLFPDRESVIYQYGFDEKSIDPAIKFTKYIKDIIETSAKILNYCRDGDIFFIGRSPENIYDFLLGALDSPWKDRLHLVLISMAGYEDYNSLSSMQKSSIQSYLTNCGLHPQAIISRKRRTCLVDFVCRATTIDNFLLFMGKWVLEEKLSLGDMQSKIETILIQKQSDFKSSNNELYDAHYINYYGWGKNSLHVFPVTDSFWLDCCDNLEKITLSYVVDAWGDSEYIEAMNYPDHKGKEHAYVSYLYGQSKRGRKFLISHIIKQDSMRFLWFRSIISLLNGKPIKIHNNTHNVNLVNRSRRRRQKKGTKSTTKKYTPKPEADTDK